MLFVVRTVSPRRAQRGVTTLVVLTAPARLEGSAGGAGATTPEVRAALAGEGEAPAFAEV